MNVRPIQNISSCAGGAISHVRPLDVLVGRGKFANGHPGTRVFYALVNRHADEYESSGKNAKV